MKLCIFYVEHFKWNSFQDPIKNFCFHSHIKCFTEQKIFCFYSQIKCFTQFSIPLPFAIITFSGIDEQVVKFAARLAILRLLKSFFDRLVHYYTR